MFHRNIEPRPGNNNAVDCREIVRCNTERIQGKHFTNKHVKAEQKKGESEREKIKNKDDYIVCVYKNDREKERERERKRESLLEFSSRDATRLCILVVFAVDQIWKRRRRERRDKPLLITDRDICFFFLEIIRSLLRTPIIPFRSVGTRSAARSGTIRDRRTRAPGRS